MLEECDGLTSKHARDSWEGGVPILSAGLVAEVGSHSVIISRKICGYLSFRKCYLVAVERVPSIK